MTKIGFVVHTDRRIALKVCSCVKLQVLVLCIILARCTFELLNDL